MVPTRTWVCRIEWDRANRRTELVTQTSQPPGEDSPAVSTDHSEEEEHFKPNGTVFILILFVAALILLWLSVYVILISRGVTT